MSSFECNKGVEHATKDTCCECTASSSAAHLVHISCCNNYIALELPKNEIFSRNKKSSPMDNTCAHSILQPSTDVG